MGNKDKKNDSYEFAQTVFIRDIESRVFQAMAYQCLIEIQGVELIEGTILDSLLGRDFNEKMKGIYVEQDEKNHMVSFKIELNIIYGIKIPDKAEEIQTKLSEQVTKLTGLHVSYVHIVFKNIIFPESLDKMIKEASGEAIYVMDHSEKLD